MEATTPSHRRTRHRRDAPTVRAPTVRIDLWGDEVDRLTEFGDFYQIPQEAARGGAETTYPEYQLRLRELMGNAEPQ